MKNVLIVGGSNGIGKSIAIQLLKKGINQITIVDKTPVDNSGLSDEIVLLFQKYVTFIPCNLVTDDYLVFEGLTEIDTLVITAGFGRLTRFEGLTECEIINLIKCNLMAPIRVIKKYYEKICSDKPFYTSVMVSISGRLVSPYYSVYGAAKAGLRMFIENINAELAAQGFNNRILDCSPGYIEGTAFNNGKNDYSKTSELAADILKRMENREVLYIPQYNEIYQNVLDRYSSNPMEFGISSFYYKKNSGRTSSSPQCIIGYLSGTFDLFHIGHLNLLKNAKKHCDYLIVGVHSSGAWKGKETFIPLVERKEIVASCKYVDKVVDSCPEDTDAWDLYHYDKLFVGGDYKGSERFERYEQVFSNTGVQIIYLPYTKTTSSTQIRKTIINKIH